MKLKIAAEFLYASAISESQSILPRSRAESFLTFDPAVLVYILCVR